jgi:hypothetical protein
VEFPRAHLASEWVLSAIPFSRGIRINYTVDSYKDLSGEAMISVILVRNTSFGFNYGVGTTEYVYCGCNDFLCDYADVFAHGQLGEEFQTG